jgi:hypothetical protein
MRIKEKERYDKRYKDPEFRKKRKEYLKVYYEKHPNRKRKSIHLNR